MLGRMERAPRGPKPVSNRAAGRERGVGSVVSVVAWAFAVTLLGGCGGGTVAPEDPRFPRPAIDALALRAAVHYPEAFRDFTHQEDIRGQGAYQIFLGPTQMELFDTIVGALFDRVEIVPDVEPETLGAYDVVLEPRVDRFEFAVPANTGGNFFEVWIRYEVSLFGADGTRVARWPVLAYGRTRNLFLDSDEAALQDALITALRDGGAEFLVTFMRDRDVRDWLEAATIAVPEGWPEPIERRRSRRRS